MLKGKTEILLTDVNTGKQECIKSENMVTNAISRTLNTNLFCGSLLNSNFKSKLNGIFLIDKVLDDDPDNFILPYDCEVIGHAGNGTFPNDNYGGIFNGEESETLNNGYKLVWDFGTNQANGIINCIALTSSIGGENGFGFDIDKANIKPMDHSTLINPTCYNSNAIKCDTFMHIYDNFTYNIVLNNNVLVLKVHMFPNTKIKFMQGLNTIFLKEYRFNINKEYLSYTSGFYKDNIYILCFDINLKIADLYEINKKSFELTNSYNFNYLFEQLSSSEIKNISNSRIFINEGYAFFICIESRTVYKINLNNTSEIIKLISEKDLSSPCGFYNNRLIFAYAILENDKFKYIYKSGDWSYHGYTMSLFGDYNDGVGYFYKSGSYSSNYPTTDVVSLTLNNHMLATKNNLSTPIIKNNTQTMKITYEITEE